VVTYRASKTFHAPIKYVYDWATDFTEGDNQFWEGKHPRVILLKSRAKAVYVNQDGSDDKPRLAVGIVTLHPAKYSWHLDYYGEEDLETGDYKLQSLGKEKTRLDMIFHNQWKNGKGPSAEDFQKGTNNVWNKYANALERDYNSGKKAK
jgi:hypothetical protein